MVGSIPSNSFPANVGIHALEFYFPTKFVDQTELEQFDGVSAGKYTIGLGQNKMAVCDDREDINSISLTVVQNLVEKHNISFKDIGYLEVGTESIIDKSKSVKTVLMSLFEESGNHDVEGIDTKNACYGGTASVFNAVNWVESSSWDGRLALVVAADIASYAEGPARPTGGAGAVAILIGPDAPVVFDQGVRSTHMNHLWDFYKPELASEYPTVDGHFSNTCYIRSVDACYSLFTKKFSKRYGNAEKLIKVQDLDHLAFHAPNCKLVQKAFGRLAYNDMLQDPENEIYASVKEYAKFGHSEESYYDKGLERGMMQFTKADYQKKVVPSIYASTNVGNMYTASVWACLSSLLSSTPDEEIVDKRIGMFSYGSGSAATFFSLKVVASAQKFRDTLLIKDRLEKRVKVTPQIFAEHLKLREETAQLKDYNPIGDISTLAKGTYYLERIDEKFRRTYKRV
ncbi:Hydroxymethylglutaryl-CoA synthase, cytoplasmic [Entomortierella chlamydospora]|uniref:Hydroxymethylglutaryl-CoA synthase n=1 Tax=Entomortierella chlamydospora TaxID=101097 RepID=A0A9P6N1U3_9FUNG|nr:Hydroxymethylglutaryl-CoA synthase, cytoplasmic [Entomortierella chlamydospora]KAG0022003.1 Hydroxymethylglutaryl-CoA synthase, cytoplasmic [Entomortierella chlamydospora]